MDFMYTESDAQEAVDEEAMMQNTLKKREKEFYGDEVEAENGIEEKPGEEEEEDSNEPQKKISSK